MTRGSLALFVGVALAVSGPNGTEAQTPSLDRVEELVAEGRFGSARTSFKSGSMAKRRPRSARMSNAVHGSGLC